MLSIGLDHANGLSVIHESNLRPREKAVSFPDGLRDGDLTLGGDLHGNSW
jgi:hypothetical protein